MEKDIMFLWAIRDIQAATQKAIDNMAYLVPEKARQQYDAVQRHLRGLLRALGAEVD